MFWVGAAAVVRVGAELDVRVGVEAALVGAAEVAQVGALAPPVADLAADGERRLERRDRLVVLAEAVVGDAGSLVVRAAGEAEAVGQQREGVAESKVELRQRLHLSEKDMSHGQRPHGYTDNQVQSHQKICPKDPR